MILDGVCGTECDIRENFDTNKYPNIFVSKNLPERISEYIQIYSSHSSVEASETWAEIVLIIVLLKN